MVNERFHRQRCPEDTVERERNHCEEVMFVLRREGGERACLGSDLVGSLGHSEKLGWFQRAVRSPVGSLLKGA